jgi:hypothetical protein
MSKDEKPKIRWVGVIIGSFTGSAIVSLFNLIFFHRFSLPTLVAGTILGMGLAYIILKFFYKFEDE